jgi:D-proline reductase (dithiol) PrdB
MDRNSLGRIKNRAIARAAARSSSLSRLLTRSFTPSGAEGEVPWTPLSKPLSSCRVALVTTAGVHHADQEPFDMADSHGDPSFRVIDAARPLDTLTITHDYYDHADADRDINVVFPAERLRELSAQGAIGEVSYVHIGFMGHIVGQHIRTLTERTAPEAAGILRGAGVDVALLTPG